MSLAQEKNRSFRKVLQHNTERHSRAGILLLVHAFLRDESGQDLIEYGLVIGLIGLGCIATMRGLSSNLANAFSKLGNAVTSAT